jgi:hypothetical protein
MGWTAAGTLQPESKSITKIFFWGMGTGGLTQFRETTTRTRISYSGLTSAGANTKVDAWNTSTSPIYEDINKEPIDGGGFTASAVQVTRTVTEV